MAVKITRVKPTDLPAGKLEAHLAMTHFSWINEATGQTGEATRDDMYDWIVGQNGKAYVRNINTNDPVYIFGAIAPNGKKYIRTAENGQWTDLLIDLEKQSATPPDATRI